MNQRKKKHSKNNENAFESFRPEPTLYSSVIQTESKIKQLSAKNDDSQLKLTASQVNFLVFHVIHCRFLLLFVLNRLD